MCRRVLCSSCNKPTFAGCGAHVEQVLGDVPKDARCKCAERAATAQGAQPTAKSSGSFLSKLFGL